MQATDNPWSVCRGTGFKVSGGADVPLSEHQNALEAMRLTEIRRVENKKRPFSPIGVFTASQSCCFGDRCGCVGVCLGAECRFCDSFLGMLQFFLFYSEQTRNTQALGRMFINHAVQWSFNKGISFNCEDEESPGDAI